MRRVSSGYKVGLSEQIAKTGALTEVSQHLASHGLKEKARADLDCAEGQTTTGLSEKSSLTFTRETMWQYLCTGLRSHDHIKHLQLGLDGVRAGGLENVVRVGFPPEFGLGSKPPHQAKPRFKEILFRY